MPLTLVPEKIEAYAARHSAPESALFRALARETFRKAKYPQMQVGHLEGQALAMLVRLTRSKRVLEIGTFTGYSSLAMAEALPPGGTLTTLDIDPETTAIARKYWAKSPAGRKITLKIGPALETLKTIRGPLDLVFIDADKHNYVNYWNACVPKVRARGLIVVDNVLWSGRVLNPKDEMDSAIVRCNRHIARDKRVIPVMLSVRDGMTLAWKRP